MNKQKIVAIVGYILIVAGVIGIAWSVQPSKETGNVTLPAGDYYAGVKVSFWMFGHVSGDYEVISGGGSVQLYVLNSEQYAEYSWDLMPSDSLDYDIGSSGSFSADMADTSTYYIVVNHVSGATANEQIVKISYKVSGLDLKYLLGGVAALAIGAVLAVMSMRMKAKAKAMQPAPLTPESQPTDVTMFDTKRKT